MNVRDRVLLGEIEALYEAGFDRFVRTATAIVGDREAGRDAVHDAFVSAIRSRSTFRGESALETWLWRIVIRAAQKARQRQERVADAFESEALIEIAPNDGSDVRLKVARLPERQKLVLFLRYYADLDYEQIAQALGVKRGTVSATLHAAHNSLRQACEEVAING
jgi:RNA polymerase sigma-70 factor, ECF subfamily